MTENLYFIFLDEIYSPNLNELLRFSKEEIFSRKNHLHFGIAGVILPASGLRDIERKSRRIKRKFYPKNNNQIFHYVDILNKRNEYADLFKNKKKNLAFTNSLYDFIKGSEFKFFPIFVDKHKLVIKYGIFEKNNNLMKIKKIGSNLFPNSTANDYNLYLLCLKKIIEAFYKFISNKKIQARGIIVAEARGEREDSEIRDAYYKITCNGISNIKATELRSIILDLFIVPKKQNYIGTQLADLVLYPTYDGLIENHNIRDDHFIDFSRILQKKLIKDTNCIP